MSNAAYDLAHRMVDDALAGRPLADSKTMATLLELEPSSVESSALVAGARRFSREACSDNAEIHGQVALNFGPCPRDCLFCAFASCNHVFDEAEWTVLAGPSRFFSSAAQRTRGVSRRHRDGRARSPDAARTDGAPRAPCPPEPDR